jgi:hypothetical protein
MENPWHIFYTDEAIGQAERLAAAGIGIGTSGNVENWGVVMDDVLAELGFPDEMPAEYGETFERTRALVATLNVFLTAAIHSAAIGRRIRDAGGDVADVDLGDDEADRLAQMAILGDVETIVREIRDTGYFEDQSPGDERRRGGEAASE